MKADKQCESCCLRENGETSQNIGFINTACIVSRMERKFFLLNPTLVLQHKLPLPEFHVAAIKSLF